jgi:hypothetical protein
MAIEDTEYYQRWMLLDEPLPAEVLRDYAEVACLCRLPHFAEERDAVHEAIFGGDPTEVDDPTSARRTGDVLDDTAEILASELGGAILQRRRSFAHYLLVLKHDPEVVEDNSAYREGLWSLSSIEGPGHDLVAGQWSALIAKDVWQDSICSIWSEFCRAGLAQCRKVGRGLTWAETESLARELVVGPPVLSPGTLLTRLAVDLAEDRIEFNNGFRPAQETLEALRRWTVSTDTAASGLITLLELDRRAKVKNGHGWTLASGVRSAWQPSLASVLEGLHGQLEIGASAADTLWWLVEQFVLRVHERIAYSKLPEFTFRFRWEEGQLQFFDLGVGRFPLAAIRMRSFGSLSQDLGLWERDVNGMATLSAHGSSFLAEVFG